MASVFLSYDRDDTARARPLALALEKAGHSVWWDLHVRGGAQFSKVIEEALKAADVVVVLWSAHSVESAWVRDEAAAGRDSGRLVPATIDGTEPPLGFRQFQTIDLSHWKGRSSSPALKMLLADVVSAKKPSEGQAYPKTTADNGTSKHRQRLFVVVTVAAIAVTLLAGLFLWRPWNSIAPNPTVLVTAGRNDGPSQALARDLALQLRNLPSLQSGSIRLITSGEAAPDKPALILELTSLSEQQTPGANLLLRSTADGSVIWSHDFEQGQRSTADMKLQMASSAGRVLGCANDALGRDGNPLPSSAHAPYLSACAETAEGRNYDPRPVIAGLSKVVAAAPGFISGWRKLLIAEADAIEYSDMTQPTPGQLELLRTHIATARRLQPDMAEATVAEAALTPPTDLVRKVALMDRAYREDPNNPVVLMRRTELQQSVGRMDDGVGTALEALDVDPTSPAVLNNYISALAYAGETDAAEQQLKRAERVWPGTSALDDLQWRFYFRFGDPRIGLKMASNRTVTPTQLMFLQARANPTNENVEKLLSYYRAHLQSIEQPDFLMQAFAQFHREKELYAIMLNWPRSEQLAGLGGAWFRPALHEFRRDPRFISLAARSPLLRYWRMANQWPDFCSEPDLPYDCKKEAAKLGA
jgi:tetratricopeptide (TPR) repeat protein